jgi:hypothetical protein
VSREVTIGQRLYATLSVEQRLFGCALLRLSLGLVALYYLIGHWAQRHLMWGPDGLFPLWLFRRDLTLARTPSLFAVESFALFDALYVCAIIASALYAIGWYTRWVQWPFALLLWSLLARKPFMLTGGDNQVQVVLPFVLALNTAVYLSLDSGWRGVGAIAAAPPRPFRALLHNVALACIVVQVCIMYCSSGLAKVMGHPWQHGTALYYVLRTQEFGLPPFNTVIYQSATLVTVITYAVMALEIFFPALIVSRLTRWLATLGAVAMHVGIGVLMGLVPFAAEALMFQFVLYDDGTYARLRPQRLERT